ncbi:MAG: hypothetical protein C4538_13245 [Nitrospiraceae bacterium]|nr:MAG: hypothetical protein C4538_13245 [Nitrospiraceae bacterium]
MKPGYHIAFSSLLAGIFYIITKSWTISVASLISGIFIDLDHIYDVLREHGRPFTIERFFSICYSCNFHKIMLPMHGWEWLLLFWAAAWFTKWNPVVVGILIGYSQHLLLDALNNSPHFLTYSLIWRWKKGFDYDETFGARLPRKKGRDCQTQSFRVNASPGLMIKLVNFLNKLY